MKQTIGIMQPTFLPWLGYFELICSVDVFVVLDDFQFSRQGWGQRNRLFLSPGRAGVVTLPIRHPRNLNATFLEIVPVLSQQNWQKKLLRTLEQTYGKAPYFDSVFPWFEQWIYGEYENVAEMSLRFLEYSLRYMGICATIVHSSDLSYDRRAQRSEKVASILHAMNAEIYYAAHSSFPYMKEDGIFPLEDVQTLFQNHVSLPYRQLGSREFVPKLSSLDAMFNCSITEIKKIMKGTRRWLSWEDMLKIDKSVMYDR